MRTPLLLLLLLLYMATKAQSSQQELDSLHAALSSAPDDTASMLTSRILFGYYVESDRDSALYYSEQAIKLAKKIDQPFWVSRMLLTKAYLTQKQGNYSLSIKLCNEAMALVQGDLKTKHIYIPATEEFASNPEKFRQSLMLDVYHQLGNTWNGTGNPQKAIEYYQKEIQLAEALNSRSGRETSNMNIGAIYAELGMLDSAFAYSIKALENLKISGWLDYEGYILEDIGLIYLRRGFVDSARYYFYQALESNMRQNNLAGAGNCNNSLAALYEKMDKPDSMFHFASAALLIANKLKVAKSMAISTKQMAKAWKLLGNADSAYYYLALSNNISDSLYKNNTDRLTQFQNANFEEQLRLEKAAQESIAARNNIRTAALVAGVGFLSILAFVFYRNNKQKLKTNQVLEQTLVDLRSTQKQLIQSEKMASLGELTSGIAHEIQNPLNFVNNFSEINDELISELVDELNSGNTEEAKAIAADIKNNAQKINEHGRRAGSIVKGMLEHSRKSDGQKEPTDINQLADECLRLAYHGMRAKDKSFSAEYNTSFDKALPLVPVVSQEISRVLLNLLNNAFYAVHEKAKDADSNYQPQVAVSTAIKNDKVVITVRDNGNGIPDEIKDKIFQPFFTTKPTGSGTGLGLSLSYDIIKAHGGNLTVETLTNEYNGTIFFINLPLQ